jgi:hypothetical protein
VEQSENYTYVFRARAVPKQYISFFLLIIGLEGCIVYNTVFGNSYDNIL